MTHLASLVETSRKVAESSGRGEKLAALADALRSLAPEEIEAAAAFLAGETRQGKLGAGYASLQEVRSAGAAASPSLAVSEVDAEFAAFAATRGARSASARRERLGRLFARATRPEQEFLIRLIVGELRQGALGGVMLDAIAAAARLPAAQLRRAAMYAPSLGAVARAALT